MIWQKKNNRKSGGHWKCRIKSREADKRHREKHGEAYKEKKRIYANWFYHNKIKTDPIKVLKNNTKARIKYRKQILGEE